MKKIHSVEPVQHVPDFPKLEEKILRYWKNNRIFEISIESRSEDKKWTFLDGPPFITGLPHYGSLLSSIPKDVFPRFWTMKGYRVRRVWGWDCHGLPAENKVEEKLGIKRKRDIEGKVGVKKFINECKSYVSEVSSEWEWYVSHVGRWVDFQNAYKTMDREYMETVMWVFSKMYKKGYIYKGLRVSLYCPHCSTPISNFEVAMDAENYKEISEPANVYKYRLEDEHDTYILAWSTTPWNKIVTPALAVHPDLTYVKIEQGKERYILAKSAVKILTEKPYKILEQFKGEELIGKIFVPHYDFYKIDPGKKAFMVVGADFVTADEGTGVVTIAAYGEDDLELMKNENIQIVMHLDEEGMLRDEVPMWAGMYYLKVNEKVNEDLNKRGLLYREDPYTHTIPNCWRCGTRLYYAPQDAWYVDVKNLKPIMKKTNERVNWFPEHFKHGRFLKSMEAAPDWCISRSRYWGSPVPVWECDCGDRFVPGSIKELEEASGMRVTDLHKPDIDRITVKCKNCGKTANRVPEVLDSWIEAGSASFAERHYPFERNESIKEFFPPDFIVEYTGQIRAWFYVLHVIAAALFESHAFTNVVVTGVILGDDGRKMSKNYGNYPDPKEMITKYGGDALRLYLMGSPVMRGEDILISKEQYINQVKGFLLPLWNVYNFFVTYSTINGWKPGVSHFNPKHVLDKWILSRLNGSIKNITFKGFEVYDVPEAVNLARIFIVKDLSTWYVRRSRDRVAPYQEDREDKNDALQTLFSVLTEYARVLAPIIPFASEVIYRNLTNEKSVHLSEWPTVDDSLIDRRLEEEIEQIRKAVENAHAARKELGIPIRQPLNSLASVYPFPLPPKNLHFLVKDELNVKDWIIKKGANLSSAFDTKLTPTLRREAKARYLIRSIQNERRKLGTRLDDKVTVTLPMIPRGFEEEIRKRTGAASLKKGHTMRVQKVGTNGSVKKREDA